MGQVMPSNPHWMYYWAIALLIGIVGACVVIAKGDEDDRKTTQEVSRKARHR